MASFKFSEIENLLLPDQKEYIKKFFIPLTNGNHIILEDNEYSIVEQAVIKKAYFNRLSADLNKFYFIDYKELRKIVCELNKPQLYDNYFNICPTIKSTYETYKDFSNSEKEGVELFLKYIKEVLASDNEESYVYILKWLANMIKGNKNDACIYLKGAQGIGKSTLCDFLKEHVIGEDLVLESGSNPLKGKFNNILQGRLLVQFSELENFSTNEWASISSTLKRIITSTTYTIEAKGKDSIQIKNINNYILDSNNDAIKDDEGRRYFIADVSHKYQGDKGGYFTKLRNTCFNDKIGKAFYSYMIEYNTDGFIPQKYPDTKSKLNSISKRLDTTYQFLRDNYILNNLAVFKTPKDLHNEYADYCVTKNLKIHDLIDFKLRLTQINIEPVVATKKRTNHYRIPFEELKQIADEKKWIHENDLEDIEITNKQTMITITQEHYHELLARIVELEKSQNVEVEYVDTKDAETQCSCDESAEYADAVDGETQCNFDEEVVEDDEVEDSVEDTIEEPIVYLEDLIKNEDNYIIETYINSNSFFDDGTSTRKVLKNGLKYNCSNCECIMHFQGFGFNKGYACCSNCYELFRKRREDANKCSLDDSDDDVEDNVKESDNDSDDDLDNECINRVNMLMNE